jgi:hypothetical protein
MARTETLAHAPAGAVFAVLCDPRCYQRFVAGTKRVRRFDPDWPEPRTTLHHTVGFGPLALRDTSVAIAITAPTKLTIWPHIRPFVVTESRFELEPRDGRTLVRLDEYAVDGPLARVWAGPLDWAMGLRNRVLLRRLARLAEHRNAVQQLDTHDVSHGATTP